MHATSVTTTLYNSVTQTTKIPVYADCPVLSMCGAKAALDSMAD